MAIIKKYSPYQNLGSYKVFIEDGDPDSLYFNVTELEQTLTGGKNSFLFEGSTYLKKGSKVRFEALDVEGNTLYIEPGVQAGKTFKDGTSIVMAIHIYDDTPIGIGSLQITAELDRYIDDNGSERIIPDEFKGRPNVRWTQTFKINPKIPNKTEVRFFKRPTFSVSEIEKPLIIKDNMTLSKSGSIIGIPEIPPTGSDFSTWTSPSKYRIKLQEGNKFTQSMDENTTLVVPSLGYSSSVLEVLNEDEILLRKPYLINNIVNEFTPVSYSMDFESIEDATIDSGSNITASYAEIRLENLATFTGDVARIKIFRKSRNDLGDFQVVQENKLDSTELLRDFTVPKRTVINYGKLRKENIVSDEGDIYYTTSSGVLIHNKHLINALDIGANQSIESNGTIGEFEIVSGSEYSFNYTSRYSGSGETSDTDSLRFLLVTSSNNKTNALITTQSIDILSGSTDLNPFGISNHQKVVKNFDALVSGKCQIRVEANTDTSTGRFLFSKLSLKNAEESSYSPDEYTAIVDIPRKNPTEQFDFRVEFYDINNNFIPIKVEQSVPFRKGNASRILSTAVNVSASGVSDAGDILSVDGGVVQIANTNIQSSTIAGLGDPTNFSSELAVATSSLETKTTLLAVATASLESQTTQLSISTASLEGTTILLNAETASLQQKHTALATETASLQAETASLKLATSSLELTTASIEAQTASLQLATASLEQTTASIEAQTASLQLATASFEQTTASLQAETASLQLATSSLEQTTASLEQTTASLQAETASLLVSASENRLLDPTTGKVIRSTTPSGTGLFINDTELGFANSGVMKAFVNSSGEFFLSGSDSNNFLRWDGSTLRIGGEIVLTNGSPSTNLAPLNAFTQSQENTNDFLNQATASLNQATASLNTHTASYVAQVVLNSSGMALKDTANTTLASYGTRTTIGPTSTEHLAISSSGLELLDGTTPRIQLSDAGIQIGSVANGITLSSDGDATFSGDLSAASGSITGSSYQGGSINIGDGTFSVNNFGDLTANSANLSGIISASAGTIGGWSAGSSNLSSNNIVLDSTNNSIDITTTNVSIEISNTGSLPPVGTSGLSNSDSLASQNFTTSSTDPTTGGGRTDTFVRNVDTVTISAAQAGRINLSLNWSGGTHTVSATGMATTVTLSTRAELRSTSYSGTTVLQTSTVEGSAFGDTQFNDVGGSPSFTNVEDTNFIDFASRTGNAQLSAGTYYIVLVQELTYRIVDNGYSPDPEIEFTWNPATATINVESSNSGLALSGGGISTVVNTSKVFRVNTEAQAYDPYVSIVGDLSIGHFYHKYLLDDPDSNNDSHWVGEALQGSNTSGGSSGTGMAEISFGNASAGLTRAMGAFRGVSSGTPSMISGFPNWNVASVTRSSQGVYVVTMNDYSNGGEYMAFVSGYGLQNSTHLTPGDDEHSHNFAVKTNISANTITINVKNNDTNSDRDPYEIYFVVYG